MSQRDDAGPPEGWREADLRGRLLRGAAWMFGGSFATTAFAILQSLLLARFLGPASFGLLALMIAYGGFWNQFFDGRSWETAVRYVTRYGEEKSPERATATIKLLLGVDLATAWLAWIIIAATAEVAAKLILKDVHSALLLQIYALVIPMSAPVGVSTAILRVANDYGSINRRDGIMALLQLIGATTIAMLGLGLQWLVVFLVLTSAAKSVWAGLQMGAIAARIGLARWSASPIRLVARDGREIAKFWLSTSTIAFLKGMMQHLDVVAVGYWAGAVQTAYYRIGRNLSQLVAFPVTPLYQVSYPELMRLWTQATQRSVLRRAVVRLSVSGAAIALVIGAIGWIAAGPLIRATAGEGFAGAAPILRLAVVSVVLVVASQYLHTLLIVAGELRRAIGALAVPVALQVIGLALFVPASGAKGAALALIVYGVARGLALVVSAMPLLQIPPPGVGETRSSTVVTGIN